MTLADGFSELLDGVPGDLSSAGVRAWARNHVHADIQALAEEECPEWPAGCPTRPASLDEAALVVRQMAARPCVLRATWLFSALSAAWERSLATYEDALLRGDPIVMRETRARHERLQALLFDEALAFGCSFFAERFARLVVRRARVTALELVRRMAGVGPLGIRDADPLILAKAFASAMAREEDKAS